ncbi:DUF1566 domain-containing protein [Crenothrix polyspora]|jgi:Protein of unknown function (DUF1566)|uniref:Lcl C-terminal domain-containing protein n=1 Tax=Crenothrix polyspora TaxID=360316 RepID=A0A1R4H895_9GAMM|nr:DUF1566 domain-containing protein [Crenothrix polyspora]SJM92251.1 conserved exported hypothetical protein [Crenothrix polyspora]
MTKTCQTTLSCLLVLPLPLLGNDQVCNTQVTATTPTARFTSFNNGTVLDKYTGLMWKKCSEGQKWNVARHTCNLFAATYTWQQALRRAQALNSKAGFAGYKDWRVPNIKELNTLVEEQCAHPAINLRVFPTTSIQGFWSSSPTDYDNYDVAWNVNFNNGSSGGNGDIDEGQVRLVRRRQ